jgi:hypothetical protein
MMRSFDDTPVRVGAAVVALVAALACAPTVAASPPEADRTATQDDESESKSPFRGSRISFEQSLAHRTLRPGGELTYDPYYNLELEVAPRWWPTDGWYVSGRFSVSQEVTHSNVTTRENELWPSDTRLRTGTPELVTIPGLEVRVSAGAEAVLPTSKPSQARTLQVGAGALLGLSRRFSVLNGLTVSYNGRLQKRFHRYQTRSLETPRISGCADLDRGCEPYAHTGQRNATARHVHLGTVSVRPVEQLSFSATGGVYVDHLYPAADAEVSADSPIEDSSIRHTALWLLDATYRPVEWMSVTGGLRSVHPQLAPDSSYYTPIFNRYAEWRLDMSVDVPALVGAF